MTLDELKALLDSTGLPVAYSHFKTAQQRPFICYLVTYSSNFIADNKVYERIENIDIELYTDFKDPATESIVDSLLDRNEIPHETDDDYIESEQLFRKTYEIRL